MNSLTINTGRWIYKIWSIECWVVLVCQCVRTRNSCNLLFAFVQTVNISTFSFYLLLSVIWDVYNVELWFVDLEYESWIYFWFWSGDRDLGSSLLAFLKQNYLDLKIRLKRKWRGRRSESMTPRDCWRSISRGFLDPIWKSNQLRWVRFLL